MVARRRLDQLLFEIGLVGSRSQAESYIKLGDVRVRGQIVTKPGHMVTDTDLNTIKLNTKELYVSRAGLKLASVIDALNVDLRNKVVLDVGSSTGGFTDYSLRHGATKIIAVDSGSNQMHPTLRNNPFIELHEKTDIRSFKTKQSIDVILIDVSFVSLRDVLPYIHELIGSNCTVLAMVKPQFEAHKTNLKHKGVIKNDQMRRQILKDFEIWVKDYFVIGAKQDSAVSGAKGNQERFYCLKKT
jgi:23S rRNA (cytidine1920-2'-O)/16S rRNA (cytidine1409-2'-O)-methyltransferase